MEELHKCKYCGVEITQPDEECYAKPAKTMTAVEWLKDKLQQYIDKGSTIDDLFNKALEMEKEQIIDAYERGWDMGAMPNDCNSEQYYNKTYKKDNQ
jgi:hypothetical protein